MKISQKRYIQGFGIVVVLLAIVRCTFFDHHNNNVVAQQLEKETTPMKVDVPSIVEEHKNSKFFDEQGKLRRHKILSVAHYGKSFPDQNDVQLSAAQRYGVSPVADRVEAEHRKSDLVYIGSNPNFHVDKLNSSIPYLVPQAAILLNDIGKSFFRCIKSLSPALCEANQTSKNFATTTSMRPKTVATFMERRLTSATIATKRFKRQKTNSGPSATTL